MQIRKLSNDDAYAVEAFLMSRAFSSMFLLSNMDKAGLEYTGEAFSGEYWAAYDKANEIQGVFAHFWNGNLMAQAPDPEARQALTTHFLANAERPLAGVLGDSEQARPILNTLNLPDHAFNTNRSEGLYQLELDKLHLPEGASSARFKLISAAEAQKSLLSSWLKDHELEALGAEPTQKHEEHIRTRVKQMQAGHSAWVLLDEGQPVSLSGFNATLPEIVQVGPVWTPPEHRSQGYARTIVALTLQAAKERGVQKSVLFTDNAAAVKAYEAIGYQQNGCFHLALLKEPWDLKNKMALA
ncbi:Acetyltransferase (GNAT) family protein [Pseudovibrio axinellae]|uniref:Acetyltransferase (GNAT) family protein n=1 Tax=Pseudovibrio axinellae TaxID=989403 RepID=A0A165T5I4_9HYPH|nr:GNAT family N-acetyltransferase [Pseudovibrio axinellae]KZL05462.1 Acetyltransferase (GNAT) family protein [Pseudovibrio axinellae]SEP98242.1 Acetyltransferase (GNAT) family protein [Pseudovibrio axinellae]